MDLPADLEAQIKALRNDVSSGAAALADQAAEIMAQGASRLEGDTASSVRSGLVELARRILEAQPAMAPLLHLADAVLTASGPGKPGSSAEAPGPVRDAAAAAARAFSRGIRERHPLIAARVRSLAPQGPVLTLSASSTVRAVFLGDPERWREGVVILESRPLLEGRAFASELAGAGIPVTVAVDAAGPSLLVDCSAVIFGADSIGDGGVVNKIGSLAVACAARRLAIPVLVPADETKFLPAGFRADLADDRPAGEVWTAPPGVRVWNRYFEAVPFPLITHLLTARSTLTGIRIPQVRRRLRFHPAIQAWYAEAR